MSDPVRHDQPEAPIGIVPISWRPTPADADAFLAELRRLGFTGVQHFPSLPAGSAGRSLLEKHGMTLAEVYAALPCSPDGPAGDALDVGRRRLQLLVEAGGDVLVAGLDGTPDRDRHAGRAHRDEVPRLSPSAWESLGRLLDGLAQEATDRGVALAFHPHAGTYVETPDEVTRLLEVTASGVGICLDTGHDIVGGGNPLETMAGVGNRLTHLHVKDVDPQVLEQTRHDGGMTRAIERRVFTTLGSGSLDLAGLVREISGRGYSGWIMVEQDTTWEPPAQAAAMSRHLLVWALRHVE